MKILKVVTKKKREVVDITDLVEQGIGDSRLINLFVKHTTAALTVADLDPGTDLDMLDAFEAMIPAHVVGEARPDLSGRPKLNYRHPHDPKHVPDHILSALVGVSLTLPVKDGRLDLGAWQRVVLMEFDGPRSREVVIF